jgi:L-iditol 2-dehydrogenase
MRVVRLHAPYDIRIHDEPIPQVGPDEVLIRIKSVGVCASDLHYYREGGIGANKVTSPLVIGHEPSGVIEEIGPNVTTIKKGDRVAIEPAKPCWECDICKAGYTNVCKQVQFFGTPPIDGALREFVAWPARLVVPIPDSMTFDEAAMMEPLAVGVYSVKVAKLKGGESIAILGAGAIGLSVLQAAKLKHPQAIIVTEPVAERRAAALKLGADAAIDTSPGDAVAGVIAANGGRDPDVVFECAGEPETIRDAAELARPLGTVVIVGIPVEDHYSFPASATRKKGLTIKMIRRSRGVTEKCIQMVKRGEAEVASYATHVFPLEQTKEALELSASKKNGVIRAMIHVG